MSSLAPSADSTAERFRRWGERDARGLSPSYEALAKMISDEPDVLALIDTLPERQRIPNVVFAASRVLGAPTGDPAVYRDWLLAEWNEVRPIAAVRTTQTNEAARCSTLLPAISAATGSDRPVALLEVGAAAGLCLFPDRYSYRYATERGPRDLDPVDGPSQVVLDCEVTGPAPVPARLPDVAWRAGIDLNPLDVRRDDDLAWLDALIFPEHLDRRARLRSAAAIAASTPPRLVRGDLLDEAARLAAEAPLHATLVIFHTVVLAYLGETERERFAELALSLPGHWVSCEPVTAFPSIRISETPAREPSDFALLVDGEHVAFAQPHGRRLHWL